MKKVAVALVLLSLSSLVFSAGCWRNGKYVNVCAIDAPQESSIQR